MNKSSWNRPYTRQEYIHSIPHIRISKFTTGDSSKDYEYEASLVALRARAKKKHIMIRKVSFYYIPKWNITFTYKDIDYSREIYAYSGTTIEDTISYCPKHFGQKIFSGVFQPKSSVALCEVCGQSLCETHVKQCPICSKWLCHEHGSQCESCSRIFCFNHKLESCNIDNKPLCSSCIVECPICNRIYSEVHNVTCDRCGRNVCSLCTISEGIIRKKHYCVNCK